MLLKYSMSAISCSMHLDALHVKLPEKLQKNRFTKEAYTKYIGTIFHLKVTYVPAYLPYRTNLWFHLMYLSPFSTEPVLPELFQTTINITELKGNLDAIPKH